MKCEMCEWWKDRFNIRAACIDTVGTEVLHLGYCEPQIPLGNDFWQSGKFKGLVASDYSCGEHTPKEDKPS